MAEPTLQEIFGAGATQTATTITILKADLAISASPTNRGEQLFAAVCKKAAVNLTTTNFGTNIDQSVNIVAGYDQLIYRTVNTTPTSYLQNQLNINFTKVQSSPGITPDDY